MIWHKGYLGFFGAESVNFGEVFFLNPNRRLQIRFDAEFTKSLPWHGHVKKLCITEPERHDFVTEAIFSAAKNVVPFVNSESAKAAKKFFWIINYDFIESRARS